MVLSGIQAKKYLPMSKGILMCILTASLPLFFVFLIAMQMPSKLFGMFFGMFLAPCFWSLGDAILNFFVLIKAQSYIGNWGNLGTNLSAYSKPIIETQALEVVSMISNMYWMIPSMAMGFATLSGYALNSAVSSIQSGATAGAGAAAQGVATGNVSVGVSAYDTHRQHLLQMMQKMDRGSTYHSANDYKQSDMTTREEGYKHGKYSSEVEDGSKTVNYDNRNTANVVRQRNYEDTANSLIGRDVTYSAVTSRQVGTTSKTFKNEHAERSSLLIEDANGNKQVVHGATVDIIGGKNGNTAKVSGTVVGEDGIKRSVSMTMEDVNYIRDAKTHKKIGLRGDITEEKYTSGKLITERDGYDLSGKSLLTGDMQQNFENAYNHYNSLGTSEEKAAYKRAIADQMVDAAKTNRTVTEGNITSLQAQLKAFAAVEKELKVPIISVEAKAGLEASLAAAYNNLNTNNTNVLYGNYMADLDKAFAKSDGKEAAKYLCKSLNTDLEANNSLINSIQKEISKLPSEKPGSGGHVNPIS